MERICTRLDYLLVLSWTFILDVKFKNFLEKKGEIGRGRMTSNCIASSLLGETKTFMLSPIINDILNIHHPLFDSFMSRLHHLRMVKHCKFVCYYQVTRIKISIMVKFYYRA